ncbi:hypothetical protein Tsubulata_015398 [Turnera subulata]|uniref:Uncharacterized protein n=1 Tax=Turnera subulata TaxID=218843 RepID=A0A9Q0FYG0_9ROSI|nr:hypothetical protein Tsubulata_015398 [Turnera subulata]
MRNYRDGVVDGGARLPIYLQMADACLLDGSGWWLSLLVVFSCGLRMVEMVLRVDFVGSVGRADEEIVVVVDGGGHVCVGGNCNGKDQDLNINLAKHFNFEIINAYKKQIYKGLGIFCNNVTEKERQGIPDHLLGLVDNFDENYTLQDISNHVHIAMDHILGKGRIPIITGGSNKYIEVLMNNPSFDVKANFNACFIWIDVALQVLYKW